MAVTVDELFTQDLDEYMKVAEELLESKDHDTKKFVTESIRDMQKFLQVQQLKAEVQLEKEIEEDEKEITSLKDRIEKLRNLGVEDPGDETLDPLKLWQDLKDNEGENIFQYLISETNGQVQLVHEKLLTILKISYETARQFMRDSRAQIVNQVIQPDAAFQRTLDRQTALKASKKNEEELNELSAQCQFKAMPFCIDAIKKNIRDAILSKDKQLCTVPNTSDEFRKAMDDYFLKCIEFSWAAAFSPILLVTEPNKECPKKILSSFEGLNKLHKLRTVKWPALVKGDSIICPWVLRERNQAEMTSSELQKRPLPKSPAAGKARTSHEKTNKQHQADATTAHTVPSMQQPKIHGKMRNIKNIDF